MLSVKVIQRRRLAKRFLRVPYVSSNDAQVTFETNFCARNPPPRKRWPSCNRAVMPGAYRTPRCEMCATFKCEICTTLQISNYYFFFPASADRHFDAVSVRRWSRQAWTVFKRILARTVGSRMANMLRKVSQLRVSPTRPATNKRFWIRDYCSAGIHG